MRSNTGFLFSTLVVALLGATAGCGTPTPAAGKPAEDRVGATAPAVEGHPIRAGRRKTSDGFSNIELQTQFGDRVAFYDDLIRDKAVIVNFFYTTCAKICTGTTPQLAKINEELTPWIGDDITMISLSIDPEVDTPERLHEYWELFGSKPGWLMLTGDEDEINLVRRQLGVYDLDPVVDADKTEHAGIITFGNDRTDRWAALPVFMHRERMMDTIVHTTRDQEWGRRDGLNASSEASATEGFRGTGEIRAIFIERGSVLIDHQAIPGLMMAMTMVFPVADPQLLADLEVGDLVEFDIELVGEGENPQIVSVSPRSPTAATTEPAGG